MARISCLFAIAVQISRYISVSGAGPRGQFGSATKGPRCRYSMAAMISAMTRMGDSAEFYGEVRNPQGDTGAELWNRSRTAGEREPSAEVISLR
jgi:hypothetical protein